MFCGICSTNSGLGVQAEDRSMLEKPNLINLPYLTWLKRNGSP
jgi:hypothetical protein